MPKETVRTEGPFVPKVGWQSGRGVQLGVETEDQHSLFWVLLGENPERLARLGEIVHVLAEQTATRRAAGDDESAEHAGRQLLDALDASTFHYAGVWSDLDRRAVNDLIRLLRRARDSAFGRDE